MNDPSGSPAALLPPLKCLEGLGLICCGACLWSIPCTVLEIKTQHHTSTVKVTAVSLGCCKPNIPCHFEDVYCQPGQSALTEAKGTAISFSCNQRPTGELEPIYAASTVTGYQCLSSGVGKIVNTLVSMVLCPF